MEKEGEKTELTGNGGLNVQAELLRTAHSIDNWYSCLTRQEQIRVLRRIRNVDGWDVTPLAQFESDQRKQFGVFGWAPRTVSVGNEVHYGHEVNYFFWGVLNATAKKNGHSASKGTMMSLVSAWRRIAGDLIYSGIDYKEHDGTLSGRIAWAEAGWDFIETGKFLTPSDVQISGATASANPYVGHFQVFVGREELRLK